ncbi:transcription-repair coupling factor [Leucobacter chinensis]|uniref:transcription-repair coupling factor n=1 Tax=Leucobacter chinensis TaxID=2851010 RepID=UPI001C2123E8
MSLNGLDLLLAESSSFARALEYGREDVDFSCREGVRAPLIAGLVRRLRGENDHGAHLVITATSREADRVRAELASLMPEALTTEFSAWETLPHERLSPSTETVGKRSRALRRIREHDGSGSPLIVVASARAVLQPVSPHAAMADVLKLTLGREDHTLDEILERLVQMAYTRVDMVTRRGEFAVRGGIVDIFVPSLDHAVRIDFFGDEVDDMRHFAISDQRSVGEPVQEIEITAARELLLTDEVRSRAAELLTELPEYSAMLEKISQGIPVEGMESLMPQLAPGMQPLTALLPEGGSVTVIAPEKVTSRAISLAETNREFLEASWSVTAAGGEAPIQLAESGLISLPEVRKASAGRPWWTISSFATEEDDFGEDIVVAAQVLPEPAPGELATEFFAGHLRTRLASGWRAVITVQGPGLQQRAAELLLEQGLAVEQRESLAEVPARPSEALVYVVTGVNWSGFESAEAKLVVLNEGELFGRSLADRAGAPAKLAGRRSKNVVDPLKLVKGDYVVHETHGIGRFVELTQRMVPTGVGKGAGKAQREYLVIEYASTKRGMPKDKLFVPTDQLDQLSRYVGGEEPTLSKMGGSDWSTAKTKARKAVRDIAVELVKLYSARMQAKGHPFQNDTPWQLELEEAFPFVETVDQLTAIDDVKRDMEKPIPMDRLISGDVGFGKTEIAVRAAFKAVQDNKQVAVLVPTTLLVKQHFETFQDRFAGFPIQLRALSRFQTDKEARETLEGLAAGTIDVVVGTHRLLSEKVKYHDLGLLIIDEEQRFGVEHKDTLKKLKHGVDILAMSATPIPRTLEMAVTGIREMSTLATAPEERHPILTFVGPRSDQQIAAAIRREMLREGQIFFVHNRVSSIGRVAARLQELVPDARIAVAHGKLSESQLEQVVIDFWERKYDVLVSTTIIETGLDIANANTIIIDQADKYGLSQLHQLRGRVGRSRERAYAYFLYDPEKPLTETAYERLETIAKNNELGSGMQVALKDLELRGAGNLLGGEQSGHIAGVGFDLYLRMIGEAVNTFKGEEVQQDRELILELPVDARIPESYVESDRLRLEAYQKFAAAAHPQAPEEHMGLVLEELTDRYGTPPEPVEKLAQVSALRRRAQLLGMTKVIAAAGQLRIERVDMLDSRRMRMARMYPGAQYSKETGVLQVPLPRPSSSPVAKRGSTEGDDILTWASDVIRHLFEADPAEA